MGAEQIVLIEDDKSIGSSLSDTLRNQGFSVSWAANGSDGAAAIGIATALVILDLGLPDINGVDLCRFIRRQHPTIQILMLTARQNEVDIVLGLEAGADDYVPKPFRLAELLARVRARLRASTPLLTDEVADVVVGPVKIETKSHRTFVNNVEIELRPKEYELLVLLARNAGHVITRDKAMSMVWDENWYGSTKTLDIHISALRKKLGFDQEDGLITTLRGVGYRLEVPA